MMPEPLILKSEREVVIEAVTTLFIGTDNRDWDSVRSCFTDTVLFNTGLTNGEPVMIAKERIVEAWADGLRDLQAIHHQIGNFLVTWEDPGVSVFCYGIAYHYLPERSNRNTKIFVGGYTIHLVKEAETWKIDKFAFNEKFVAGNIHLGE
ncbi:MAG TPA: nuclear transport factor 2 family protein [Methanoregulaceae archaeon]|nr:nuclear transport factor 2 family protein [Methanoregulaceae archaeon]